jgi:hypothetical protein
MVFLTCA